MLRPIVLILSVFLLLSGCSLLPSKSNQTSGTVSTSWYCVKDSDTGKQTCEKRRLRNGKPVDDEVLETIVIPVDAAAPIVSAAPPPHNPPANAGDAVPWSRQPLTTINRIDDTPGLEVENIGPELKKARDTADIWGGDGAAGKQTEVRQKESDVNVSEPNPQTVEAPTGYTLQLAAFSTSSRCDNYIAEKQSEALAVEKRLIAGLETDWCIVVHGDFSSEEEAQAAAERYTEKYPQINFWTRSWASIQTREIH